VHVPNFLNYLESNSCKIKKAHRKEVTFEQDRHLVKKRVNTKRRVRQDLRMEMKHSLMVALCLWKEEGRWKAEDPLRQTLSNIQCSVTVTSRSCKAWKISPSSSNCNSQPKVTLFFRNQLVNAGDIFSCHSCLVKY
jgi:hypothetical protein